MNPLFTLSFADAEADLARMQDDPQPLARPVIIAGGYFDPGCVAGRLGRKLSQLTEDDQTKITTVTFFGDTTFEKCRAKLIDHVEEHFPGDDLNHTVEVDCTGVSMGGLIARYAAVPNGEKKRLKIARLFTISTPHRGARLAALPTLDQRTRDMRAGSDFLQSLDEALPQADYQLLPYTRTGDLIVGSANTSPNGLARWWVSNPPMTFAHIAAPRDARIIADIARRLRSEQPHSQMTR